jgi:hypothetical protein
MDQVKSLFESKTFWFGLLGVLTGITGFAITPEDQITISTLLAQAATVISGLGAIYGRLGATKRIE